MQWGSLCTTNADDHRPQHPQPTRFSETPEYQYTAEQLQNIFNAGSAMTVAILSGSSWPSQGDDTCTTMNCDDPKFDNNGLLRSYFHYKRLKWRKYTPVQAV